MATTVTLKPNAIDISGSTSGTTTLQATAVAGTTTITLPAATDTLVGKATTDTLTNKTLTSPTITGGALNGTLGATTPNTVAATSITASTTLSVTGAGSIEGLTVGKGGGAVATNTAVGVSAGALTSGGYGCYVGYQAGIVSTGEQNTAVGGYTLVANTTGLRNSGFGTNALYTNTTGSYNTALGNSALALNTTASNNTAVGYQAGYSGTTANQSVAIGNQALYAGGGGVDVAVGYRAFYSANINAGAGVAVGASALNNCTTGYYNTAVGYQAGASVTTGIANVLIGINAGNSTTPLTTGNYNIFIGAVGINAGSSARSYSIVLATEAQAPKGDSTFFAYANGGASYNGGNTTTWTTTSDRRIKKNIVDNNDGLNKLAGIRVRNFEYRLPEEIDAGLASSDAVTKSGVQLGVIAQELQAVLPECVKEESTGVLSVNSDNLTWHMINAIKDLKALVDAQAARIATLESK